MYDRGYRFQSYDLVITAVRDLDDATTALEEVGLMVVEPTFEHGAVWRVPRAMTNRR